MKTFAALLLGLSSALVLNSVAVAEPFGDRGEDFIASVGAGAAGPPASMSPAADRFGGRGGDFVSTVRGGSAGRYEPASPVADRFGARGDDFVRRVGTESAAPSEPMTATSDGRKKGEESPAAGIPLSAVPSAYGKLQTADMCEAVCGLPATAVMQTSPENPGTRRFL